MTEKILNLQLNYKGKYLDTVRYNRDFNKSFYVGKQKHLFWQINDDAFPQKHKFIAKSGSKFKLFLNKGMSVKINKNGAELSEEDLKREKILTDGTLIINENTEGVIDFPNDWSVKYFFKEPYKYVPSREHIEIHKKFAKTPKPSEEVKFTRIFIVLGLLFTAIGLYIGEMNYEPPEEISFAERFQRIQETATRIETDIPLVVKKEEEPTGTFKKETEEATQQAVEQAAEMTSADFATEFGLELEGGIEGGEGEESFAGELLEVSHIGEIVAAGPATGTGSDSKARKGAEDLELAGSGGFDLSSAGEGLGDFGSLGDLDLGGSGGFEEVDMASLGGDVGSFKVTKVKSKAQFQQIKKKYAGIKIVQEGSIKLEEQSPAMKTELANITQIVNTYKPQITKLYTVESMMMDMYGTLEINLIIGSNGNVEAVDITVSDGSFFTDSFISKTRDIIMKWKIKVKDPVGYSFRMKFYK